MSLNDEQKQKVIELGQKKKRPLQIAGELDLNVEDVRQVMADELGYFEQLPKVELNESDFPAEGNTKLSTPGTKSGKSSKAGDLEPVRNGESGPGIRQETPTVEPGSQRSNPGLPTGKDGG